MQTEQSSSWQMLWHGGTFAVHIQNGARKSSPAPVLATAWSRDYGSPTGSWLPWDLPVVFCFVNAVQLSAVVERRHARHSRQPSSVQLGTFQLP